MDQVKIGKFIARLRHENGLTQQALGDKLGVTNKTISRWENGNYMPDIEMLSLLSRELHISINELICGERLEEKQFREAADANLVSSWKQSSFSLKERTDFWKRKWRKEHRARIFLCVAAVAAVWIAAWIWALPWLAGAVPVLACIFYMVLRNQMMIYVEGKVFD